MEYENEYNSKDDFLLKGKDKNPISNSAMEEEIRTKWKRILIRDEVMKLYFDNLGMNDSLTVERLTNLHEITKKNANEKKALFAIVETKARFQEENEFKRVNNSNYKMIYPDDDSQYDDSLKFLSLAYSGFSLVYDKEIRNLYMPDTMYKDNNEATLLNFILHIDEDVDDDERFQQLFNNDKLMSKHNKFAKEIFGSSLNDLPEIQRNYSLFFIKNNKLCEYVTATGEIIVSNKNINEADFREELHNYMVSLNENKNKKFSYLNNVTVFLECDKNQEEIYSASNNLGEIFMIVVITLLYLINYLITFPENQAYELNQSIYKYFALDKYGNNKLNKISDVDGIMNYIFDDLMENIYKDEFLTYITQNKMTHESESTDKKLLDEYVDEELRIEPNNYYLQNKNYFSGLLITFDRTEFEPVSTPWGNQIKRKSSLEYYRSNPVQDSNPYLSFGSYEDPYPFFELMYKSSFSKNINYIYKQQLNPAFDKKMSMLEAVLYVYNPDLNLVSILPIEFGINTYGVITKKVSFYNINGNLSEKFIPLLIINIIYVIFLLPFFFIVIKTFLGNLYELIKNRNYNFNWYDYLDLISLALNISSMILFYVVILFHGKTFPIAIPYKEEMLYWIQHAIKVKGFQRVTGFTMILMMIRLVRFLFSAYPQMGIVFLTISGANKEIMAFAVILTVSLVGIFSMAHSAFGWYTTDFYTLNNSAISTFFMFLGMVDYEAFINTESFNKIAPFFFIAFMIFFNLNLLNMFLCIIRNNYIEVKEKNEMKNLSNSMISSDDRRELFNNIYNLILFKNPLQIEEENQINNKNESGSNENEENEEKVGTKKVNIGLWKIFRYNLSRINIRQFITGNIRTKEEIIKKTYEKFQLIRKMKIKDYIKDIKINFELEFNQAVDSICFILFIIVFLIMMYLQMKEGSSDSMDVYVLKSFLSFENRVIYDSFNNVDTTTRLFLSTLYHNQTSETIECDPEKETLLDPLKLQNYVFLNPPYLRMRYRFSKYENSNDEWQNSYFPQYLVDPDPLDSNNCNTVSEFTSDINIDDDIDDFKYPYTPAGSINTTDSCGGFVYLVNKTSPFCVKNEYQNYDYISKFLFNENLASVTVDMALFSIHYDFIVFVKITAVKQPMANIPFEFDVFSIPINKYETRADFVRMILEIIYLVFVIYYLIRFILELFELIAAEINRDNQFYKNSLDDPEEFEKFSTFNKFFRFRWKKHQNKKGISLICSLFADAILTIIGKLFKFVFIVLRCSIQYVSQDFFNVINIISIIISISMTISWYNILSTTIQLNFDFSTEVDDSRIPNIFLVNKLEDYYKTYLYFQSINGLLIFIRMIQFFKFSHSIYSLICVILKASSSILYHLIFIFLINIGFALCGYSLFGHSSNYFSSVAMSLLSMTLFLAGRGTLKTYNDIDSDLLPIIVLIYNLINILILCNILSAIIIESFRSIKNNEKQADEIERLSFFYNLKRILSEKIKIFWNTCRLYLQLLKKEEEDCLENLSEIKILQKQFENDVNDLFIVREGESAPSKFKIFKEKSSLKRRFLGKYLDRLKKIESLSDIKNKKTKSNDYKKVNIEEYKTQNTDNQIDLNKIILSEKKPAATLNKTEDIKTGKVTIMVKFITYVYLLVGYEINDLIQDNANSRSMRRTKSFMVKSDSRLNKYNKESTKKQEKFEEVLTEEQKKMKEFIKNLEAKMMTKGKGFYKTNIFKKYLGYENLIKKYPGKQTPYRFSKEAREESSQIDYESIQYVNNLTTNTLFNLDLKFCIHNIKDCQDCKIYEKKFKTISATVYDILIKNFYRPEQLSKEEMELYYGYYIYTLEEQGKNIKYDKNLIISIESQKLQNFICEIIYLRFRNFEEEYDISSIVKDLKKIFADEISIKVSKESAENSSEILELYKSFLIWNTVYVILYEKNKNFTRKLRDSSKSNEVYQLYKNDRSKFYTSLFVELFQLYYSKEDPVKNDVAKFRQNAINKLNEVPELFNYNFNEDNFYFSDEKYLLDEVDFKLYSKHLPKEKIYAEKVMHNTKVFTELWKTYSVHEKFRLFFGHTRILKNMDKDFLVSNEFLENFSKYPEISTFFTPSNQAQVLTFLKISDKFMMECQREISVLFNDGDIPENKIFNDVSEILKYFFSLNLNSLTIFKFFRNVFDRTLKSPKDVVKNVDSKTKAYFKELIGNHPNIAKDFEFKLALSKFYQLAANFRKYEKLIGILFQLTLLQNFMKKKKNLRKQKLKTKQIWIM